MAKTLKLAALRAEVCRLNLELPKEGLVTWTSGNVSIRDPKTGWVVIKPSGVKFQDLTPANQVIVDLDGKVIEGTCAPSVDAPTHLYIYRKRPDVCGVVHTHSQYATAFAAVGKPIPIVLTAMADEFGGAIPCGPYSKIGGEEIGETIVKYLGSSPGILLKNHGVFTVGKTGEAALKAAVMVEDVARTVHHALLLGKPDIIPAAEVARAHKRYTEKYGQHGGAVKEVDKST
ncbi:MAG: L-ribulose-5-phosphate 4-epimerase [Candidatus Coatesbacteria bacterium]